MMEISPAHPAIAPLKWLLGTWRSISAEGSYPTISPFEYCEEISFTSLGQPILNYNSKSWHPTKLNPMHLESGFLRIKPETDKISFLVAHNFGITSLEEGNVSPNLIKLKSTQIARMSFSKDPAVTEIQRRYKLNDNGQLESVISIATINTPLCQHLKVVYTKVCD